MGIVPAASVLLVLLFLLPAGAARAQADHYSMPSATVTPGAIAFIRLESVCSTKWGLDARIVSASMKAWVCTAYGLKPFGCPGPEIEIDHLVPRDLGGADDRRNLWPQPIAEAKQKDQLEVWARQQVCAGALDLVTTQRQFAEDWRVLYKDMHDAQRPRPRKPGLTP